jgi:tRNA(Arg) A34 adenosine deaminase TadA
MAERRFTRCLPCLGTGRMRLLGIELYETHRPCPYCKGAGERVVFWRAHKEVVVADEMKFVDMGRCKGAFHLGKRAPFGRVVCSVCGGRFRPVQGLRVPNHVSAKMGPKTPPKDGPPRASRK